MKLQTPYIWTPDSEVVTFTSDFVWIEYASSESIFVWLKTREYTGILEYCDSNEERFLLSKNDPFINLGLAIYGRDLEVLEYLYENGDERIRRFVLSGVATGSIFHGGFVDKTIQSLIEEDNLECINLVLQNQHTTDSVITHFLTHSEPFNKLSDESWFLLLIWLSSSARFKCYCPKNEVEPYEHEQMFDAAWQLFEFLLPNELDGLNQRRAVSALHNLALNMRCAMLTTPFGYSRIAPSFNIDLILQKWQTICANDELIEYFNSIVEVLSWVKQNQDPIVFAKNYELQNHRS